MRRPTDLPRAKSGSTRRRAILLGAAVAIVIVFTLSRSIAGFYTDALWFGDLGAGHTFSTVLAAKAELVIGLGLVFFLLCWLNLRIADRLGPPGVRPEQMDEVPQRFQLAAGPYLGKLRVVFAAALTLLAVSGVSGEWQALVLYRHRTTFGTKDPQFHHDVGFYVFQLPLMRFLLDWTLLAVLLVLVATAVGHYLGGGIRVQGPTPRALPGQPAPRPRPPGPGRGVSPGAKAHLSIIAAAVALLKAVSYWLDRFDLLFSGRGVVHGALFTDISAKLPALQLMLLISVTAAVLFLVNLRRRGSTLPGVALGLWVVVSVLVGALYPTFVQNVRVKPDEGRKEAKYIARNIAATRAAFKLDKVETRAFPYTDGAAGLTAADLRDESATVRNIRLWDPNPRIGKEVFSQTQKIKDYYEVKDVDIDRYAIDGEQTEVSIGVRELRSSGLPNDNWQNQHLAYTHGYGAIIAPANGAFDGEPTFSLKDLPPVPTLAEPRVYFGEGPGTGDYAVVGTKQGEVEGATGAGEATGFTGTHGVGLSGPLRRAAFALRFGDWNLLISNLVTAKSRVLYVRQIQARLRKVAPFLEYDQDPYPVVLDGRILWVVDAYTATDAYPYSEPADLRSTGLPAGSNYVRNSVKAVVDAYDGSVKLYDIDETDPLARAYRSAFPQLFRTKAELPAGLEAHFRYPEDLFKAQAGLFARYHIDTPSAFYSAQDRWTVSVDQGSAIGTTTTLPQPGGGGGGAAGRTETLTTDGRIPPVYQLQRLPGDAATSFSIVQPYVPFSSGDTGKGLSAFLSARSDPGDYGKLVLYRLPSGKQVDDPSLVDAAINNEATVSTQISLLNQGGSHVLFGNILLVPIKTSILYVRPLYVVDDKIRLPKLERVVIVYGNRVTMKPTLREALIEIFGDAPATREVAGGAALPAGGTPLGGGPSTAPGGPGSGLSDPSAQAAIAEANAAFAAADEALRKGDLAEYQKQFAAARAAVARLGGTVSTRGSTATTPTTSSSG